MARLRCPCSRWVLAIVAGAGIAASLTTVFLLRRRANSRRRRLAESAASSPLQRGPVATAGPVKYQYSILPRTWKARLLLALAFAGGLCLIAGYITLNVFALRDDFESFEGAPCEDHVESCLPAQSQLAAVGEPTCEGVGLRICFVPLGKVDPEIVLDLSELYRTEYGMRTGVMTPSAVPKELVDGERQQIDGRLLARYMGSLFPSDYLNENVVLIGLAPLDLYSQAEENWLFEFGEAEWSGPGGGHGVVSTYRMHAGGVSDEKVLERTRKMVTKYVGLMYMGFEENDDPTSPIYGHIMGVDDLDRMADGLFASH